MSTPSDADILQALEKSGYLFEQDVATAIEKAGFTVDTSWAYQDPTLEKSREIDIRAVKQICRNDKLQVQVFVELLVECKNSDSPFVFIERLKNARERDFPCPNEYVFPFRAYKKQIDSKSYQEVSAFQFLDLAKCHYYYRESAKATQFAKIVRKGSDWLANHEGIYDSLILPLAKALEARRNDALTSNRNGPWKIAWLFFPMVVIRDQLYSCELADGDRALRRRGRVSFVRHLESDELKGMYLVDFVDYANVLNHVQDIIGFADVISKAALDRTSAFWSEGAY